jgi:hypothetical protein
MMLARMVFCGVVSKVGFTWSPSDIKLFLVHSVPDPIEPHIHCFGFLLFHGVVDNALCSRIIGIDWRCLLWVS